MRTAVWCVVFAGMMALMCGCGEEETVRRRLRVGGAAAAVEVAATPEERARGLMGRREVGEDEGMIFLFPESEVASFWMKDTHVALSIAFISAEWKIAEIQDMEPGSLAVHKSRGAVTAALEMPAGWFERNGVKVGDAVDPEELREIVVR